MDNSRGPRTHSGTPCLHWATTYSTAPTPLQPRRHSLLVRHTCTHQSSEKSGFIQSWGKDHSSRNAENGRPTLSSMTLHTECNVQAIALEQCLSYFALSAEPNSQVGSHQQTQVQAHLDEEPLSSGASAATAVKADEASCGDSASKVKSLPNFEAPLYQCIHTNSLYRKCMCLICISTG